jgi:hypothetical protein
MTQNVETKTLNDFDQACALIASYHLENADDTRLPEIMAAIKETCGHAAFNKILVLLEAAGDPRFFGAADVPALLRDLEITSDVKADAERLLSLIAEQDAAAYKQAEREAAEINDPYRQATIRLLTKFREPNIEQVMYELTNL